MPGIQQSILSFLEYVVESQKRRGSENDCRSLHVVWTEKQRPESKQQSIDRSEIGRPLPTTAGMQELEQRMEQLPGPINDQKLLFHEKAIGDNGLGTALPEELGERCQQMCKHQQQGLHERVE